MKTRWLFVCAVIGGCDPGSEAALPATDIAAVGGPAEPADAAQPGQGAYTIGAVPAESRLCQAREAILFECRLSGDTVAVCGGTSSSGKTYAQYRHGNPRKLDLVHPASVECGAGGLVLAQFGYSGGGEAQIHFAKDGYRYVVYSRVIRTGFGPDGHNNPAFESGVAVKQGSRVISDKRCAEPYDADLDAPTARRFLPEGERVEWVDWEGADAG